MSSWKGFVSFQVVHSNPLKDGLSPSLTWKGSGFSGILNEFPGVFRWQGAVLPFSFSVLFSPRGPRGVAPLHRDLFDHIVSLSRVAENVKRGSPERSGFKSIFLAVGRGFGLVGASRAGLSVLFP